MGFSFVLSQFKSRTMKVLLIVALALAAVMAEPEADASAQYLSYFGSPGSSYGSYYGYPGSYYGQRYYSYPGTFYGQQNYGNGYPGTCYGRRGQRRGNRWGNNNLVSVFKREAEAEAEADPAYYRTYGYVRPYVYNPGYYGYFVRPSVYSYGSWW